MDGSGIIRKSDTAMPAFSSTALTIEDLGGELQFTATRRIGWLELVLTTSVITGCGVYGFLHQEYVFLAIFAVSLSSAIFDGQRDQQQFCASLVAEFMRPVICAGGPARTSRFQLTT